MIFFLIPNRLSFTSMQATTFVFICAIALVHFQSCSPTGKPSLPSELSFIQSHSVATKSANSMKGTLVVAKGDKGSLTQSKDQLSNELTKKLKADSQNSNANVKVNNVQEAADGSLLLEYECDGVDDTEKAKNTLKDAVKQGPTQKTTTKSSKTDLKSTEKPKQQTTNQPG